MKTITSIYSNAFILLLILLVYPKLSLSVHRRVCAAQGAQTEQPRAGGCGRTGRLRADRAAAGGPAGRVRGHQAGAFTNLICLAT